MIVEYFSWGTTRLISLSYDGLSYDETLFLSYQKVQKKKIACSYSKEGDIYRLDDSPLM